MNIYQAIIDDHEIQRNLVDQLVETSGDTDKRHQIFSELKKELSAHADSEERHFYVSLIKKDATQEESRHGIAEHHEIDELVAKLEETEASSPAWLKYAKDLAHKVKHHLEEEEEDYFPIAKKVIDEKKSTILGQNYLDDMQEFRKKYA